LRIETEKDYFVEGGERVIPLGIRNLTNREIEVARVLGPCGTRIDSSWPVKVPPRQKIELQLRIGHGKSRSLRGGLIRAEDSSGTTLARRYFSIEALGEENRIEYSRQFVKADGSEIVLQIPWFAIGGPGELLRLEKPEGLRVTVDGDVIGKTVIRASMEPSFNALSEKNGGAIELFWRAHSLVIPIEVMQEEFPWPRVVVLPSRRGHYPLSVNVVVGPSDGRPLEVKLMDANGSAIEGVSITSDVPLGNSRRLGFSIEKVPNGARFVDVLQMAEGGKTTWRIEVIFDPSD
jgi:hypothetical protein